MSRCLACKKISVSYKTIKTYFEYLPAGPQEAVWTFHVSAIGHACILPGKPHPPPRHPEGRAFTWERGRVLSAFQLLAISQGRGILESRSGSAHLSAGSVFLLPPGYWHRNRPEPETGWTEDWVELGGPTLAAWLGHGILDVAPVHMNRRSAFWGRFAELHRVCIAHQLGYRAIASDLAMTLLASVVSQSLVSARTNKPALPDLARQARELLMQGRDVKSIARALGVSYLTLYRKFKQATGLAPKEYAKAIRLARAEDLLACGDLSVKEIAGRLGYHSASHLSLEFKKARGKPPLAVVRLDARLIPFRRGLVALDSNQALPFCASRAGHRMRRGAALGSHRIEQQDWTGLAGCHGIEARLRDQTLASLRTESVPHRPTALRDIGIDRRLA